MASSLCSQAPGRDVEGQGTALVKQGEPKAGSTGRGSNLPQLRSKLGQRWG